MRWIALAALVVFAGCTNPRFGAVIEGGSNGVTVAPSASGNIGNLTVGVRG